MPDQIPDAVIDAVREALRKAGSDLDEDAIYFVILEAALPVYRALVLREAAEAVARNDPAHKLLLAMAGRSH